MKLTKHLSDRNFTMTEFWEWINDVYYKNSCDFMSDHQWGNIPTIIVPGWIYDRYIELVGPTKEWMELFAYPRFPERWNFHGAGWTIQLDRRIPVEI